MTKSAYEFVLPNSSSEIIDPDSGLKSLSVSERRLARNEIYAKHGRKFDDPQLQAYFRSCTWYDETIKPENFNDDVLNQYEKANLEALVALQ